MNRTLNRTLTATCIAMLAMTACEKKAKPKDYFLTEPKVEYDIKVTAVDDPGSQQAAGVETWATRVRDVVRIAHEDLQRCRNEYLIPFQFEKMRRRNVEFVNITEMDAVCMDGDPSLRRRGPMALLRALVDEAGRNTTLDRFLVLSTDQLENYKVFAFMTKKIGAPNIGPVTDTAKAARDRILIVGSQIDALASEIAKWPDGQKPEDDPQTIAQPVELAAFQQQLLTNHGWFMSDLVGAYDRYAAKSWEAPNMPKLGALHLWVNIPQKRLQLDRVRLSHVQGGDEKQLAAIKAYFDAVEVAVKAVNAGFERYEKYHAELDEKDPNHKAVEQAQAAVLKLQKLWLPTEAAK